MIPDNVFRYYTDDKKVYLTEETKPSFEIDRILIIRIRSPKIKDRIIATLETNKRATLKTLQQIYFKTENESKIDLKFLLAILNSNLMNFYCTHFLVDDINKDYLSKLPIPNIDLKNVEDNKLYDTIVKKVSDILELQKQLSEARNPPDKDRFERRIKATNNAINEAIYNLYNITPQEIDIIESVL